MLVLPDFLDVVRVTNGHATITRSTGATGTSNSTSTTDIHTNTNLISFSGSASSCTSISSTISIHRSSNTSGTTSSIPNSYCARNTVITSGIK